MSYIGIESSNKLVDHFETYPGLCYSTCANVVLQTKLYPGLGYSMAASGMIAVYDQAF